MSELSTEQQNVLSLIREGNNVLITGPAGTGKSFLLDYIRVMLRENGTRYAVTASTGAAAANVGGVTVHSWAGIGLGDGSFSKILEGVRYNKPAVKRILSCQVLLIDEVSMISADLLDLLDKVLRSVRGLNRAFGGLQLIFIGDFAQIQPVHGQFCFKSQAWSDANVISITLTKIFRQEDADFARALNKLRLGSLDDASKKLILSRYRVADPDPSILPVSVVSTNAEAARINDAQMSKLPGKVTTFVAEDTGTPAGLRALEKLTIPKELGLKVGARVVCIQNLPKLGLVNGSAGTVTDLSAGVTVCFDGQGIVDMPRHTREICQGDVVIASRNQFPLKIGWALTSHSVQGLSLDKISVHMGGAFSPAQTYVAISRVRTLEGLFIESLNKANIGAHPDALAFYSDSGEDGCWP